jgi:hypothetical protein
LGDGPSWQTPRPVPPFLRAFSRRRRGYGQPSAPKDTRQNAGLRLPQWLPRRSEPLSVRPWQRRRNIPFGREASNSMATSRFKLDAPSTQTDTRTGFGRGSAVREYWLERCQGFSAVRTDGRPLGRVKRVESRMDGTFLRLNGIRARAVPISSVDTVWPGASVLLISDEDVDRGSGKSAWGRAHPERPAWEDETLPWWELFADGLDSSHYSTPPSAGSPLSVVASARSRIERTANAIARCARRVIGRSRTLTQALIEKAVQSGARALQATHSAATRASRGLTKTTRRFRRRLARELFKVAVWIAGSRETILKLDDENRGSPVEDDDTAEIN